MKLEEAALLLALDTIAALGWQLAANPTLGTRRVGTDIK
mgnify:CR=1 FL=1